MSKLTLNTISAGFGSTDLLNENFQLIEEALENTLSRDGTSPNSLTADLDLNGHRLLNAVFDVEINTDDYTLYPGTLGNMSAQNKTAVDITGGTIVGITDLAIADGGTGASTAANARTNLGLAIGTNVQAYDADLAAIAALPSNGIIAKTGAGTASVRTITAGTGISVSNGDGVSGNPTISLSGSQHAKYTHETTSGTAGGSTTSGSFQTRTLNTEVYDDIGITLSSNVLTLPAGTYYISGVLTFYGLATNAFTTKCKLRNTTDSSDAAFFQTGGTFTDANAFSANYHLIMTREKVVIAGTKNFEVQYYTSTSQSTNGMGQPYSSPGTKEVFAELVIEKVA